MGLPVVWIALFAFVVAVDVLVAVASLAKHSPEGRSLGFVCLSASIVTASYLASAFVDDYFWFSVLSSIYFIGIDSALTTLLIFVRNFVNGAERPGLSLGLVFLIAWGVVDVIVLAVNPFFEVAISYGYMADSMYHYGYIMHFPYYLHLTFAYVNIVMIVVFLVDKAMRVPSVYRRQYEYAIASLALVVGINACYLYMSVGGGSQHILDFSLLGYSVAAALFYWICFMYREHGMLDALRGYIFASMGQGVILFDYDGKLLMQNARAPKMLEGFFGGKVPTAEDMAELLPTKTLGLVGDGSTHTFQCYPTRDQVLHPLVCEYRTLLGGKRNAEVLGFLFMLSELSSEYDPLTGFYSLEVFQGREADVVCAGKGIAMACDINDLAGLNAKLGHDEGDRAIQELARLMRVHLPADAVFVRENDAVLAAVCEGMGEEEIRSCIEAMRIELKSSAAGFNFQSGTCSFNEGVRRSEAVLAARDTLRMRKLLDPSSRRSESLFSLVRMLQACDPDTEAHVRRTQKLCDKLGERIGLSDEEQGNLALLALLHDIGKTSVPLDILNKPGKLTEAERRVLMNHVVKGYQIAIDSPDLRGIADMILYHHERWDGKGYPDGLSKESIPLLSRIISVVDSYDAMTNDRPYREAMAPEQACRELKRCAGTQFDPTLVASFLQMLFEDGVIRALPQAEEPVVEEGEPDGEGTLPDKPVWRSRRLHQDAGEADLSAPRVHLLNFARYTLDGDHRILEVDEAFAELTGYSAEDVAAGLTQFDLIFDEDQDEYFRMAQDEFAQGPFVYLEHWIRRKDGRAVFVFCMGHKYYSSAERENRIEALICDASSSYSVHSVIQREYDSAIRRLERWESKYRRDPLTGLLNHEAFKNDTESRLLAGDTGALMLMIDVDFFKEYNDSYGHHAGDELLAMVAQTLMSTLRKSDFACRMGGDEFAALLFFDVSTPRATMEQRAAQILDKLNLTLAGLDNAGASLSMGGAFLEPECDSFEQLYEAADRALYRSKNSGKAKLSF